MRRFPLVRLAGTAFLTFITGSCLDQTMTSPADVDPLAGLDANAVVPIIHETPGTEPGTVHYTVRVVSRDTSMASIQGTLHFPPGSLAFVRSATPPGSDGEMRIVNIQQIDQGVIPFAAFAPGRLSGDELFTVTVRKVRAVASDAVYATLEVAGSADGTAKATPHLRRSEGLRDGLGRRIE